MTKIQTILCAHDFSEASTAALRYARDLARDVHATLCLVHAVSPGGYMMDASAKANPGMFEDYERAMSDKLRATAAGLGEGGDAPQTHVAFGKPHEVILSEAARLHADLIVMAAHGHNAAERFFLGSVADRVLRTATIPVMVVRGP